MSEKKKNSLNSLEKEEKNGEVFSLKKFLWNYLRHSPWYMWVIRFFFAFLLFLFLLKFYHFK